MRADLPPTARRILELLDQPQELEALYRQDPQSFGDSFDEAFREVPDSPTLRVWRARLEYSDPAGAVNRRRMW